MYKEKKIISFWRSRGVTTALTSLGYRPYYGWFHGDRSIWKCERSLVEIQRQTDEEPVSQI